MGVRPSCLNVVRRANPGSPDLPSIASGSGVRWIDYRKTLTPRYGIVWRDISLCYLCLALGVVAVVFAGSAWPVQAAVLLAVPVTVWLGFWMHALFLFCHEAAHYNLASPRRHNDRLADWLVWLLFGSTTRNYRRTHMVHHVHLGDHQDTETTYHLCLSVVNIVKAATGLFVIEVLRRKAKAASRSSRHVGGRRDTDRRRRTGEGVLASARSGLSHMAVVCALGFTGAPVAAASWALAVACVFPLFATIRTIIEHRQLEAPCSVDFSTEIHGPVNRMFGTGLCARYFGSAGFNRHLLHHWDPAISYTRFDEMERFLLTTPLEAQIAASRTSYRTTIGGLIAVASNA